MLYANNKRKNHNVECTTAILILLPRCEMWKEKQKIVANSILNVHKVHLAPLEKNDQKFPNQIKSDDTRNAVRVVKNFIAIEGH